MPQPLVLCHVSWWTVLSDVFLVCRQVLAATTRAPSEVTCAGHWSMSSQMEPRGSISSHGAKEMHNRC